MKTRGKWLFPLIILLNIALPRTSLVAARDAIILTVTLEGLLWLVGARQVFVAWRRYRHERNAEQEASTAFASALGTFLPERVARLFALEARLWITIVRWVVRRGPGGPAVFHYHRRSPFGMIVLFCLLATPIELLLWELLIPWGWLRLALFVLGIYGLIWIVGFYASFRTIPHQLDECGIWLHYGLLGSARLPYDAIVSISTERRSAPKHNDGIQTVQEQRTEDTTARDVAFIGVGGRTDVLLVLNRPVVIERPFGANMPVTAIHIAADQPSEFVAAIERTLRGDLPVREQVAAALQPG